MLPSNIQLTHIYSALSSFVNNKTEYLFDRYGRRGNMVNKMNIYAFQPVEINDEYITVFERAMSLSIIKIASFFEYSKGICTKHSN